MMESAATKILMTTDTVGGVWNYSVELARELVLRGHDVLLAALGPELSAARRRDIARLRNVDLVFTQSRLCWMDDPWRDVAHARGWLCELERSFRPDVIHVNTLGHAAADWRAPVLTVGHSCVLSWFEAVKGAPAPWERWARYRAEVTRGLQRSDIVAAPTRAMAASLQRHYGPLPRVRAIYNGVTPSTSHDAEGVREPVIVAAGRVWDEAKNVGALARVAPRLRWPVEVAGEDVHPDGGLAGHGAVKMLGSLPHDALMRRFQTARIFAHPARYEPFGLTPLEAALSGCALVLGDIETLRELWDGAAIFVDPDDDDALVDELTAVTELHHLREDLQRRARERAREFGLDAMVSAYEATYAALLTENGRRAMVSAEGGIA